MSRLTRFHRSAVTVLVGAALVVGPSGGVHAHSDVEFTLPTDGASVAEPITEISIGFTQAVTLIGPGFEVLDPQGNLVVPFVVTDDDIVFRLQIDPPIGGGDVGVRYEVTAQDGHVISGSFSFTVSVPAPTIAPTTAVPVATAPPPVTAPIATVPPTSSASTAAAPTTTVEAIPATSAPPVEVTTVARDTADGGGDHTGLYIAIALAVAMGALAFLGIRRAAAR